MSRKNSAWFVILSVLFFCPVICQAQDLLTQGLAAQQAGKHDQAVELFQKYLTPDQDSVAARRYLAASLAALGRKEAALATLNQGLQKHPRDTALLLAKGKLLAEMERRQEALETFNRILSVDGEHCDALKERGDCLAQEGRYEDALADFNRAAALNPADPWTFHQRGMVQFCLGHYQQAVDDFSTAIRLRNDIPLFYFARGQIYLRHLNDRDKGVADFKQGCKLGHPLCCQELQSLGVAGDK